MFTNHHCNTHATYTASDGTGTRTVLDPVTAGDKACAF